MAKRKPPTRVRRSGNSPDPNSTNVWQRGASRLSEQGRLMWLLGEGLGAALAAKQSGWSPPDEESLAADLFGWTQRVLSQSPAAWSPAPVKPVVVRGPVRAPALTQVMIQGDLTNFACPVLWVGSREIGGEWVSLALAVGIDGLRRVVGLSRGSVRSQEVAMDLVADLANRGLNRNGLLVVTEGSRTLDRAVEESWRGVSLAHCRTRLRREIMGCFPDGVGQTRGQELDAAWLTPVAEAAVLLKELEARWSIECPGAAERLARSREASLTVARLKVSSPLKERLESAGTLRMAFKKGLRWAPPGPGISALAVGIPMWLQRSRRLVGWRGLELLAHTLRGQAKRPENDAAPTV